MLLLLAIFIFFFGLALGSFLAVILYRFAQEELGSIIFGRSFCDHCQTQLSCFDNIPLLSFLLLKGRCRYCQQKIDVFYFYLEFLSGLFLLAVFLIGLCWLKLSWWGLILLMFLSLVSWFIFWFDLKFLIIPDLLVIGLLVPAVIIALSQPSTLLVTLFSSVLIFLLFFSLWLITKKKGFGLGDVKLVVPLSLLLGFPQNLVGVFLAFIIGAGWGIILLSLGQKKFGQKIFCKIFFVV